MLDSFPPLEIPSSNSPVAKFAGRIQNTVRGGIRPAPKSWQFFTTRTPIWIIPTMRPICRRYWNARRRRASPGSSASAPTWKADSQRRRRAPHLAFAGHRYLALTSLRGAKRRSNPGGASVLDCFATLAMTIVARLRACAAVEERNVAHRLRLRQRLQIGVDVAEVGVREHRRPVWRHLAVGRAYERHERIERQLRARDDLAVAGPTDPSPAKSWHCQQPCWVNATLPFCASPSASAAPQAINTTTAAAEQTRTKAMTNLLSAAASAR